MITVEEIRKVLDEVLRDAARNKLRFQSTKGELTLEQLWDIPLGERSFAVVRKR